VKVDLDEVPEDEGSMPIMAENWKSLIAFLGCETQWRVVSTRAGLIWLGLDYVATKVLLDFAGFGKDIFDDIRTMEMAALPVLNEAD
jgi:hypothetical protein